MALHQDKKNRAFKCIFCESPEKLTKEHIWADWLRGHLPRTGERNYHWTRYGGGEIIKGKVHRPGDAHSQRLQVVCGRCNSGWMGSLQEAARPILAPLLQDVWEPLDEHSQRILGRWATMTTMVIEFADPKTARVPQTHRDLLRTGAGPLEGWYIWIGRHDPGADHPGYFNHFGWIAAGVDVSTGQAVAHHHFQTTTFTVGRLLIHTIMMSSPHPEFIVKPEEFEQLYDLRTIWPANGTIIDHPVRKHDWESRQTVAEHTARRFGLPIFRAHDAPPG